MQQNRQGHRFPEGSQQQPVYRFPQNQPPVQGWQAQQNYSVQYPIEEAPLTKQDKKELKKKHKRRRIFTLWNLFAVIGMITVLIQTARYIVIPFLVYLNVLAGGVL